MNKISRCSKWAWWEDTNRQRVAEVGLASRWKRVLSFSRAEVTCLHLQKRRFARLDVSGYLYIWLRIRARCASTHS